MAKDQKAMARTPPEKEGQHPPARSRWMNPIDEVEHLLDEYRAEEERGEFYRREICSATFFRIVALPATIEADRVQASFQAGRLEVTMAKAHRSKRRHIALQ